MTDQTGLVHTKSLALIVTWSCVQTTSQPGKGRPLLGRTESRHLLVHSWWRDNSTIYSSSQPPVDHTR